jgi:hypothetical protein
MGLGIKYKLRYAWVKLRCTLDYWLTKKVQNGKVAVHCMFQNEAPFIKEWLDYYLSQGVDHVFLTNDNSTDGVEKILEPYRQKGWLTLEKARQDLHFYQREMFHKNNVLSRSRGKFQWVAFVDSDEFIFHESKSLKQALAEHQQKPGLVFSSFMYGTSGVQRLGASELMLEQLVNRFKQEHKEHKHVKSCVQPGYGFRFFNCNPHYPQYAPQARLRWCDGERFRPAQNRILAGPMRLNHYWYRTVQFYEQVKRPRRIFFEGGERKRKIEQWHSTNANAHYDPVLAQKADELKDFRKKHGF